MITRENIEEEIKLFALFIDSDKNIAEVHLEHSFAEALRPHSKRIQKFDYINCDDEDKLFCLDYYDEENKDDDIFTQSNESTKYINYSHSFEIFVEKTGLSHSIINKIASEFYPYTGQSHYQGTYIFKDILNDLFLLNKRIYEANISREILKEKQTINQIIKISKEFLGKEICDTAAKFITYNQDYDVEKLTIYLKDNEKIYEINTITSLDDFAFGKVNTNIPDYKIYKLGSGEIIEDFDLEASEEAFDLLLMMEL